MPEDFRVTSDDIDASGEESVGGTAPTPDQNIVEDLATATGTEIPDSQFLQFEKMLLQRDEQRWELEPKSAEDYEEHQP